MTVICGHIFFSDMSVSPDWVSLFSKLGKSTPPQPSTPPTASKCQDRISESSVSDQSMGNAIRALFEESSLSSLGTDKGSHLSLDKSDSVLECMYNLLKLNSTEKILAKSRWTSSIPATPCNSRSETPESPLPTMPQPSISNSSSLQGALQHLFEVERKASIKSSATASLKDLGDAMRRLFYTASMERFGVAPKPSLFGTSNTSLADAMRLLFDSNSRSTITNTSDWEDIPISALFESDAEETSTKTKTKKTSHVRG